MAVSQKTELIHSSASIHRTAVLGENVSIGPWVVIGPHVSIGDNSRISSHVVIHRNTRIGHHNIVHPYVSLGGDPQDLNHTGHETGLEIGNHNVFREFVTINRGSSSGTGCTYIGDKNFFLSYSHVAHDCHVNNEILMVNNATLAGHVTVDDYAVLGAFTAVHQFCRVGSHSFLSRATEVSKDVPPYMLVKGLPGFPCGLNIVGLKRRGFSKETIQHLKKAYQIMYRSDLKLTQVKKELEELVRVCPEVQLILNLINESQRGVARRSI